jgi:hypothetical protein
VEEERDSPRRHLEALRTLKLGWNAPAARVHSLVACAGSHLRSLSLGLGATLPNDGLLHVAHTCRVLEHLRLSFQPVSDQGVCAAIRSCARLGTLSLKWCAGPFSDALGRTVADTGCRLRTLKLLGGAAKLTRCGLRDALHAGCLTRLALLGCPRLHAAQLVALLSPLAAGLTHLRLEACGGDAREGETDATDHTRTLMQLVLSGRCVELRTLHLRCVRDLTVAGASSLDLHTLSRSCPLLEVRALPLPPPTRGVSPAPSPWGDAPGICPCSQALVLDYADLSEAAAVHVLEATGRRPAAAEAPPSGLLRFVVLSSSRATPKPLLRVQAVAPPRQPLLERAMAGDLAQNTVRRCRDGGGGGGVWGMTDDERRALFPRAYCVP